MLIVYGDSMEKNDTVSCSHLSLALSQDYSRFTKLATKMLDCDFICFDVFFKQSVKKKIFIFSNLIFSPKVYIFFHLVQIMFFVISRLESEVL